MIWLRVLIILAIFQAGSPAHAFDMCQTLFAVRALKAKLTGKDPNAIATVDELIHLNRNAQVKMAEYTQTDTRQLRDYSARLGRLLFDPLVGLLAPEDTYIDAGSAAGLVSLELAKNKNVHAIAISTADYWSPFLDMVRSLGTSPLELEVEPFTFSMRVITINGFISKKIERFAAALDLDARFISQPFNTKNQEAALRNIREKIKLILQDVGSKIAALKQAGKFDYRVGYVEKMISSIIEKAKLITDVYGAYHYSVTRKNLIELYYNQLTDDGTALVYISNALLNEDADIVHTTKGDLSFIDYLIAHYPDNFRLVTNTDSTESIILTPIERVNYKTQYVLVIKKTSALNTLTLPLELDIRSIKYKDFGLGFKFPVKLRYTEKSSY